MTTNPRCASGDATHPAATSQSVLPLRLSAFENYMFIDDRPSHPMVFVIEIEVSGDLQPDVMQSCVKRALRQHPLLTARVGRQLTGRHWVPARHAPEAHIIDGGDHSRIEARPIDLRREPGCRVWIRPDGQNHGRILFEFHHAATDGLGAMQFIGDVLVEYAHATARDGQDLPRRRVVDRQVLKLRGRLDNPGSDSGETPLSRAKVFFRQLGHSASRLVPPRLSTVIPGRPDRQLPPFVSRTLDQGFADGVRKAAARRLLYPNDLYVASLFKSVHDWNQQHEGTDEDRIIRLSLPTSLRLPQHDACPAANVVNMVFVNRREADCGDLSALLDRADEITNASTHDRVFYRAMSRARWIPGLLEVGSRLPYTFATTVLTNVGDVKRQFGTRFPLQRRRCVAGSIVLEGFRGTAPLRPGTHVGISIGTYASQLFVNAICDPHIYSRQDATAFLDLFLDQLVALSADHQLRKAA